MSASSPTKRAIPATELLQTYGLVLVLVALFVAVTIKNPGFADGQNLLNVLQQWAPVGVMAVAGTYVVIGGGFDLSVGGVYALGGVVCAGLAQHTSVGLALVGSLLVGLAFGVANGILVTKAHVNSFIATLGVGQIARGLALVLTGATPIVVISDNFAYLGTAQVGPVALTSVIFVVALLVGGFLLGRSVYGRSIYAIGGNAEASRLSGIPVDRRLIFAYAMSGMSAALAGSMVASRLGTGQATAGDGIEFDVVIAIVLGGTALSGGFGAMWRTGVGLALLAVMQNGFDSLRVDAFYQVMIKGSILIAAVSWDQFVGRKQLGGTAAPPADQVHEPPVSQLSSA